MIIDYRQRHLGPENWIVVDAETGEDLAPLSYFYADDEAGLLWVHLRDDRGNKYAVRSKRGLEPAWTDFFCVIPILKRCPAGCVVTVNG